MADNSGEDEQDLKSEIFNALGVFDLELSARTPDGAKFWLDCKQAIDKYAAQQEQQAVQKALEALRFSQMPEESESYGLWVRGQIADCLEAIESALPTAQPDKDDRKKQ